MFVLSCGITIFEYNFKTKNMKTQRIKELNEMYLKGKEYPTYKIATPLQRLKSRIVNIILDNRFVALTIYLLAFLFTIFFSIEF